MTVHVQHPQPGRAAAAEPQRTRVLIVDSHARSRQVCADYCDLFDHISETADDGEDALAALRRGRFNAVVMNLHPNAEAGLAWIRIPIH